MDFAAIRKNEKKYAPLKEWFISDFKEKNFLDATKDLKENFSGGVISFDEKLYPYLNDEFFENIKIILRQARRERKKIFIFDDKAKSFASSGGEVCDIYDYRLEKMRLVDKNSDEKNCRVIFKTEEYKIISKKENLTDIFNPDAVKAFFESTYDRYITETKKFIGFEFCGFVGRKENFSFFDTESVIYSDYISKRFLKENGYSIWEKANLLFFEEDGFEKVRYDYYKTIEIMISEFRRQCKEYLNERELLYVSQDEFTSFGNILEAKKELSSGKKVLCTKNGDEASKFISRTLSITANTVKNSSTILIYPKSSIYGDASPENKGKNETEEQFLKLKEELQTENVSYYECDEETLVKTASVVKGKILLDGYEFENIIFSTQKNVFSATLGFLSGFCGKVFILKTIGNKINFEDPKVNVSVKGAIVCDSARDLAERVSEIENTVYATDIETLKKCKEIKISKMTSKEGVYYYFFNDSKDEVFSIISLKKDVSYYIIDTVGGDVYHSNVYDGEMTASFLPYGMLILFETDAFLNAEESKGVVKTGVQLRTFIQREKIIPKRIGLGKFEAKLPSVTEGRRLLFKGDFPLVKVKLKRRDEVILDSPFETELLSTDKNQIIEVDVTKNGNLKEIQID